jgi:hypothetical protein
MNFIHQGLFFMGKANSWNPSFWEVGPAKLKHKVAFDEFHSSGAIFLGQGLDFIGTRRVVPPNRVMVNYFYCGAWIYHNTGQKCCVKDHIEIIFHTMANPFIYIAKSYYKGQYYTISIEVIVN